MADPIISTEIPPSGVASSGGILSSLGTNLVSQAPDLISKAASGIANSGTYGADNSATVPLAPTATGAAETEATNAIPGTLGAANTGLQQAAQTEKGLVTPVGAKAATSGAQQQNAGAQFQAEAIKNYQQAVSDSSQSALNAESALSNTMQKATINPQQYLENMGVGQKTLTAIGLALSGLGSGLTGQPNIAMQTLQTNINRDIAAQQQIFQNRMESVAQQRGLLQSAQDRQNLALHAGNLATVTVSQGVANAISGIQAQVKGATAPSLAPQLILQNQQNAASALSNINAKYVQTVKSGNTKNVNQLGLGFDTAAEHLNGSPLGLNKNPLQNAQTSAPGNAILSPADQQKSLSDVLQSESNKRNDSSAKPTETFLDAIARTAAQ